MFNLIQECSWTIYSNLFSILSRIFLQSSRFSPTVLNYYYSNSHLDGLVNQSYLFPVLLESHRIICNFGYIINRGEDGYTTNDSLNGHYESTGLLGFTDHDDDNDGYHNG